MKTRMPWIPAAAVLAALALSGCVANTAKAPSTAKSDATTVTVESTADDCIVSQDTAPSGTITFSVTNSADAVSEFYLLGADGSKVIGEVEDLTPGLKGTLTVQAKPGKYFTACKPGMSGKTVGRKAFTVTG